MTITVYNGIGRAIPLYERPLEPPLKPSDWYREPEEEADGIDLDGGGIWSAKGGFRKA